MTFIKTTVVIFRSYFISAFFKFLKNSVGYRWWAAIGHNKRNVIALTDDMAIDIARLVIDGSASPKNNQDQPNDPKEQLFLKITRRVANPTQKP